jgi:hypothetical protein
MAESIKAVAPFAWEAYQDYAVKGLRFSRIEQGILEQNLPNRVIDDLVGDVDYQITATLIAINLEKKKTCFHYINSKEATILLRTLILNGNPVK